MTDCARLLVGLGCCLLLAGFGVLAVAGPTYTTEVERSAPSERAMANASASYSTAEIDAIPFADLAAAEQRAVEGAIAAPDGRYTDRGASENGTNLEYRNDVIRQSVVGYEDQIYLVRTWIAVDYLLVPVGAGGVVLGLPVLGVGAWRWRWGNTAA